MCRQTCLKEGWTVGSVPVATGLRERLVTQDLGLRKGSWIVDLMTGGLGLGSKKHDFTVLLGGACVGQSEQG